MLMVTVCFGASAETQGGNQLKANIPVTREE